VGIGYALSAMGWLALVAGAEDEAERMVGTALSAHRVEVSSRTRCLPSGLKDGITPSHQ
jgi:hypothetical protein